MTTEPVVPLRRAMSYTARLAQQPRLLRAAKTSLAAVLAWYLAPLIPFTEDQYSYYAPLGALVTMHPTLARSARAGVEILAGLALGIGLGLAGYTAVQLGVPGGLVLAVVIGVGVLLGGITMLGAGGDWAPLAALFVLLTGGRDPEGFSISYLGATAFGVVVGLAVNFLIVPPLYLRGAGERLTALRDTMTTLLDDAADAVTAGRISPERFTAALDALADIRSTVTDEVDEADESARANPRRRRHRREREENVARMAALERAAFLARDLIDLLLELEPGRPGEPGENGEPRDTGEFGQPGEPGEPNATHEPGRPGEPGENGDNREPGDTGDTRERGDLTAPVRAELARAIRAASDLLAVPLGDPAASDRLNAAIRALTAYQDALGTATTSSLSRTDAATGAAIELCLRRMIDVTRPFV